VALSLDGHGRPVLHPGPPVVTLWAQAARRLGLAVPPAVRPPDAHDVALPRRRPRPGPVPVRAVAGLAEGDRAVRYEAGGARLLALLAAELWPDRARALATGDHGTGRFAVAAAVADTVPVLDLRRPRFPWGVPEAVAAVLEAAA
jgi:hypothetical protein